MSAKSISRRKFLKQTALTTLGSTLLTSSILKAGNAGRLPNILFFITDDMYPDMMNFLPEGRGKNLTPNLDRLAREGTILMNQYVSSPVCTPSRFTCLTGKYASRATNEEFLNFTKKNDGQTVIQWNTFIVPGQKILPDYLKEAGYVTGMVGKNHAIEVKGLKPFDDYFADPTDPKVARQIEENYKKVQDAVLASGFDYADGLYNNNPDFLGLWKLAVHNMDWITDCGLKFIEKNKNRPFFLYFATTVPHDPSGPERSWKADKRITAKGVLPEAPHVLPPPETYAERFKKAGIKDGHNKENVLWLDDSLGALIKKLEDLNLLDNTIIFFFNDHGQKAKGTLYQGGVHDPSVVWKKGGFPVGHVSKTMVSNVDFVPTILDFTGTGVKAKGVDGKSFKPVLDGKVKKLHDALYFELGYARAVIKGRYKYLAVRYPEYLRDMSIEERKKRLDAYNKHRLHKKMRIVTTDPTKPYSHLMALPGGGDAERESTGKKPGYYDPDQLYDLQKDPNEMHNLAGKKEYQAVLQDMKQTLRKFLNQLPGKFDL